MLTTKQIKRAEKVKQSIADKKHDVSASVSNELLCGEDKIKDSDLTISESGDYFYIMQGDSDADCWPQYKEAANPDEEMIIRLCREVVEQNKQLEEKTTYINGLRQSYKDNEKTKLLYQADIDELSGVVIELSDWIENSTCFDDEYDSSGKGTEPSKVIRALVERLKLADEVVDTANLYVSTSMGLESEKAAFHKALAKYKGKE